MPNFISEDQIERALLQKLQHLHGFDVLNCHTDDPEDLDDESGRASKSEVLLLDRVKEAAVRLNPGIPEAAIDGALETLMRIAASCAAILIMAEDRLKAGHQRAENRPFRRWCTGFSRSSTSLSGHNANSCVLCAVH